jgi:hypothetical protein
MVNVLRAREVRQLPEMAKVTVNSRDKYGYPTRTLCFVHHLPNGDTVLQNMSPYCDGYIQIVKRKGVVYTVEEE